VGIQGSIGARSSTQVTVASDSGAVVMAAGSSVASRGGDIVLQAASGVAVGRVDARGSGGVSGLVTIDPGAGAITDANRDSAADIHARAITVHADGAGSTAGDTIEVATDMVYVDAGSGLVVRESGTDGRVYYSVLRGAELRQQLVTMGPSSRVTSDPQGMIDNGQYAQLQEALASGASRMAGLQSALSLQASSLGAVNTGVQSYLSQSVSTGSLPVTVGAGATSDLMSDQSYGLSGALDPNWVLGSPGAQPLADGSIAGEPVLDYWTESLAL
jgi:hypothetical protein